MVPWLSHIPKYSDDCFSVDYLGKNAGFSEKLLSCGINIPIPGTDILLEKRSQEQKQRVLSALWMRTTSWQWRPLNISRDLSHHGKQPFSFSCTEGEMALLEMLWGPDSFCLPGLTTSSCSSRPPAASLCISLPGSFFHNWGKSDVPGDTHHPEVAPAHNQQLAGLDL